MNCIFKEFKYRHVLSTLFLTFFLLHFFYLFYAGISGSVEERAINSKELPYDFENTYAMIRENALSFEGTMTIDDFELYRTALGEYELITSFDFDIPQESGMITYNLPYSLEGRIVVFSFVDLSCYIFLEAEFDNDLSPHILSFISREPDKLSSFGIIITLETQIPHVFRIGFGDESTIPEDHHQYISDSTSGTLNIYLYQ